MTAKAADKLKSDGWKIVETSGFLHLIGPLWQRVVDGTHEYGEGRPDWAVVATLVKQAYREVAPPRLRAAVPAE